VKKEQSLKVNSIIIMISNIIKLFLPMITFPYLTRVIEKEGMGRTSFISAFCGYFIFLASLGMSIYARREIANVKNDGDKVEKLIGEMLFFRIGMSLLVLVVYFAILILTGKFLLDIKIYIYGAMLIFLTDIGLDWVFEGMEEYIFLNIRGLIFQIMVIIAMLNLIKEKNDYHLVTAITVASMIAGGAVNYAILIKRKIITKNIILNIFRGIEIKKHIKPIIIIGMTNFVIVIYMYLDINMLEWVQGSLKISANIISENVGIYSAGIRLNKIVITALMSLSGIMMVRLSKLNGEKNEEKEKETTKKWLEFIYLTSIPAMVGMYILAEEIIVILAGKGFYDAVLVSKILIPTIFISCMINFAGTQLLVKKKEKVTFKILGIGIIFAIILNYIMIKRYTYNGAAVGMTLSSAVILFLHLGYIIKKRYLLLKDLLSFNLLKIVTGSLLMGVIVKTVRVILNLEMGYETVISVFTGIVIYGVMMIVLKENLSYSIFNNLLSKYLIKFIKK
jgi:O-antigen/teichoic acid export membrane protein